MHILELTSLSRDYNWSDMRLSLEFKIERDWQSWFWFWSHANSLCQCIHLCECALQIFKTAWQWTTSNCCKQDKAGQLFKNRDGKTYNLGHSNHMLSGSELFHNIWIKKTDNVFKRANYFLFFCLDLSLNIPEQNTKSKKKDEQFQGHNDLKQDKHIQKYLNYNHNFNELLMIFDDSLLQSSKTCASSWFIKDETKLTKNHCSRRTKYFDAECLYCLFCIFKFQMRKLV